MGDVIHPRTLKGFRDLLPAAAIRRERLVSAAIDVYRRYGYAPIDTPALELAEILTGGGGADAEKQMYRFDDAGGREVAMRFDLTVPLARFAAQHIDALGTPFKRYHIAPVWRGENPQKGRYREFLQCDFDTIGTESPVADIETVLVVHDLFAAVAAGPFTIRVNDRRILNAVLTTTGLAARSEAVLRALDRIGKVGAERVAADLEAQGVPADRVGTLLATVDPGAAEGDVLDRLAGAVAGDPAAQTAIDALGTLLEAADAVGIPAGRVVVDGSIARGLDYYTGIVFETYLDQRPDIGSCCSGGRYDDLASRYTSRRLPGVGGSLGVDRLLAAIEEQEGGEDAVTVPVLVTRFGDEGIVGLLALADSIRRAGIAVEVYPDADRIGKQLRYADRRRHRLVVIAGPDERAAGTVTLKDMATGEERPVTAAVAVEEIARALGAGSGATPAI
jgi:histidyl-tRNA synthetase